MLSLVQSECFAEVKAEVGGRKSKNSDGIGVPCPLLGRYTSLEREAWADKNASCGDFNSGSAGAYGWLRIRGGGNGPGVFELHLHTYVETQAIGGCNFDSRAQTRIHFLWTVVPEEIELEYRPLFACESNGRNGKNVSAILRLGDQSFDLEEPCDRTPVRVVLHAGDTVGFDAELYEQRNDNDSELRTAFSLRLPPEHSPPGRDLGFTADAPLNQKATIDRKADDAWPDIATDAAGTWLAVWRSNVTPEARAGDDFDIFAARSSDQGRTWTEQEALNSNATDDSGNDWSPKLVFDGRDAWVATWTSDDSLEGTIGEDQDVLTAHSTDAGATWSAPIPVNTNAPDDSESDSNAHVATSGDGHLVVLWTSGNDLDGASGPDLDILIAHSSDRGVTWSPPTPVDPGAATDGLHDYRPRSATDGRGHWMAVWSTSDPETGSFIQITQSYDDGWTWSLPSVLDAPVPETRTFAFRPDVASDGDGTWIVVWYSNDPLQGTSGEDWDILYARSDDDGATWSAPAPLDRNADRDSGTDWAARITSVGPGWFAVAWVSDDPDFGGAVGGTRAISWAETAETGQWKTPLPLTTIDPAVTEQNIHPALAADADGNVVVVWDSTDPRAGTIGTDPDIFAVPEPHTLALQIAALAALLAIRRRRSVACERAR